jgi:two-component system, sensor histidine kinase LadS
MRVFLYLWFLLLLTFPFTGSGQETIILTDTTSDINATSRQTLIFKDCTGKLIPGKISAGSLSENIVRHYEDGCSTYLLHFSTQDLAKDKHWYVEVQDPHIDSVWFYDESGRLLGQAGFALPFNTRPISHKNFTFRLPEHKGEVQKFWIRLRSGEGFGVHFRIRSDDFFIYYSLNEYLLLGMYYGIIFIMALYNLFLFFSVREKIYLYYVFYALSCAFISFSEDGLGFQYLWGQNPSVNYYLSILTRLLLLTTFIPYATSFLNLRTQMPEATKYIWLFYFLYLFTLPLYIYGILKQEVRFILFLAPFVIVYYCAVKMHFRKYQPARYFIAGYTLILISLAVFLLRISGLAGSTFFIVYCFNFGFVLEVVILSLALGERLRIEKTLKEVGQKKIIEQLRENQALKDKLNSELEIKIAERTRELQVSNEQLVNTNAELEKAYALLRDQAEEIEAINKHLDEHNQELQLNVKELAKARVMFREVRFEEFSNIYPDEDTCMKYLAQIKWEKGYTCRKCENENSSPGRSPYSKRCTRCGYEESSTAFTIFHRNRIPLNKAFYMVFLVSTHKKEITSEELSRKLEIRQKTCWSFKQKIVKAINESSGKKFKAENWGTLFLSQEN